MMNRWKRGAAVLLCGTLLGMGTPIPLEEDIPAIIAEQDSGENIADLLAEKEAEEKRLKGGVVKAEWGQQIRSYWFYGNRLVKDHRSNWEDTDVDGVMDGRLEEFVGAYLHWRKDNV